MDSALAMSEPSSDTLCGVSEEGYIIELFDMSGNTVAALRLPTPADRPIVRALNT